MPPRLGRIASRLRTSVIAILTPGRVLQSRLHIDWASYQGVALDAEKLRASHAPSGAETLCGLDLCTYFCE